MWSRSLTKSSSLTSRTRRSPETPVAARVSWARVRPMPKMYGRATSRRFSRGRSTPTRRAMCRFSYCLGGLIRSLAPPVCSRGAAASALRVTGSRRWVRLFCSVCRRCGRCPGGGAARGGGHGEGRGSALVLLVTRVRADDHAARVATDHLAVVTDRLDARLELHCFPYLWTITSSGTQ